MPTYIVTVTAADRVGIVHSVTGTIREAGGNILELSQTVLRDHFTIILAVEFPDARNTRTLSAAIIANGATFDLNVEVIDAAGTRPEPVTVEGERFILTVLGPDRPGIIHAISGGLAERGVNIVDLHARMDNGRFAMIMEAFLPHDPQAPRGRSATSWSGSAASWGSRRSSSTRTSSWPRPSRAPSASAWRRRPLAKEPPLYRTEDVLATLGMVRQHKLDVRTVTMGVDLQPCASPDLDVLCDRIKARIVHFAGRLRSVCKEVEGRYGIPIVNRRVAVSPIASVAAAHTAEGYLAVAHGRSMRSRPRWKSTSSAASRPWSRRDGPTATGG